MEIPSLGLGGSQRLHWKGPLGFGALWPVMQESKRVRVVALQESSLNNQTPMLGHAGSCSCHSGALSCSVELDVHCGGIR